MCLLDDNYSLKKQGSLASLGLREKTPLLAIIWRITRNGQTGCARCWWLCRSIQRKLEIWRWRSSKNSAWPDQMERPAKNSSKTWMPWKETRHLQVGKSLPEYRWHGRRGIQNASVCFLRMTIVGKRERKVPVLITPLMRESLDTLTEKWEEYGVLKENDYLFALAQSIHYL